MHCFVFSTADAKQDNYRCSKVYAILLQICTVATTNKAMCKYCSRICGGKWNPDLPSFILVTRPTVICHFACYFYFNPLNAELNHICYLLALLGAHHFLHVSRIRVKSLTLRLLMSYIYIYIYIYMEHLFVMFLDHTHRRTTVGRTPLDE